MSVAGVYCNVCFELHSVSHVYALPCGHAYCAYVLTRQTCKETGKTTCPHCKQQYPKQTRRRLFIDVRANDDQSTPYTTPELDPDYTGETLSSQPMLYPPAVQRLAAHTTTVISNLIVEDNFTSLADVTRSLRTLSSRIADYHGASHAEDNMQPLIASLLPFVERLAAHRVLYKQRMERAQRLEEEALRTAEQAAKRLQAVRDQLSKADDRARSATDKLAALKIEMEAAKARADKLEQDLKGERESKGRMQSSLAELKKRDVKRKEHEKRIKELEAQLEDVHGRMEQMMNSKAIIARNGDAHESGDMAEPAPADEEKYVYTYEDTLIDLEVSNTQDDTVARPSSGSNHGELPSFTKHLRISQSNAQRPRFSSGNEWSLPYLQRTGSSVHQRQRAPSSSALTRASSMETATKKRKLSSDVGDSSGLRIGKEHQSGLAQFFPIQRDGQGRARGAIALGPRVRLNSKN